MKHIYALLTLMLIPIANADSDFLRRYGANSQIYDLPFYYSHNRQIACPCCQPTHKHHPRCVSRKECCETDVEVENKRPIYKYTRAKMKNKKSVSEKELLMREKQEKLELERKKLEDELAVLNSTL